MHNLNVSMPNGALLSVDGFGGLCGSTPRTPEILNSLIAMSNPMEYPYTCSTQMSQPDSPSSCSASPLDSPAGGCNATSSVEKMCSQLIKASLKQSIQSKRKLSGSESSGGECYKMSKMCSSTGAGDTTDDDSIGKSPKGLTPEDEDRRRRRRERNKIAATKCRMKKREKTINLVQESEILENQNVSLKTEARDLETQRQKLVELLEAHKSKCVYHQGYQAIPFKSPAFKYLTDLGFPATNNNTNSTNLLQTKYNNGNNNNNCSNSNNNNNEAKIKYSRKHSPPNTINFCTKASTLPPGYCKPSPTSDINYGGLSTDSGFLDTITSTNNTPNHISCKQDSHNMAHHFTQHSLSFKPDYIPNCDNSNTDMSATATVTLNHRLDGKMMQNIADSNDFIALKSELQDSTSPYTTVQSADRFLFENSEHFIDIDRMQNTHTPLPSIKDTRGIYLEYNGNIQSFDAALLKSDFLQQSELFESSESQFTDLDSGITSLTYTNITSNGGCPA